MVIALVHLTTLVNVIWGGLVLIVPSTVGVIIIPLVMNNQEYVISVKIGLLDNFVNTASKLNELHKIILGNIFNTVF